MSTFVGLTWFISSALITTMLSKGFLNSKSIASKKKQTTQAQCNSELQVVVLKVVVSNNEQPSSNSAMSSSPSSSPSSYSFEEILPTTLLTSNPSRVQTENLNSTERPSTEEAMPQRVAPIVNAVKIAPDTFSVDNGDDVDLSKLFYSCGITSLGEKSFNFCAMDVYKHFWLKAAGYRFVDNFFVLFKKHQDCFIKKLFFCTEIS
jgi:hypothetical protein